MLKVHIFANDKYINDDVYEYGTYGKDGSNNDKKSTMYMKARVCKNIVTAHESEIGALTVNADGTLMASASTKGTVIRILSVEGGEQLQELRRGSGKADINMLIFHPHLNLLACCSNRRSIHVFEIKKSVEK